MEMQQEIDHTKLKNMKEQVKSIEGESKGFMEPEPPKEKKSRGRPKGSTENKKKEPQEQKAEASQAQEQMTIPTAMITMPIAKSISVLGESYCKHSMARMTDQELESFSMALGLVMDKYLPDVGSQFGPEMVLVMVSGQYMIRLVQLKKAIQDQERAAKARTAQATTEPTANPKEDLKPSFDMNYEQETNEKKEKVQ